MQVNIEEVINDYRIFFTRLQRSNHFSRLGKTFSTNKIKYLYDTGTGKVLECEDHAYMVLDCLFRTNDFEKLLDLNISQEELINAFYIIKQAIEQENILLALPVDKFLGTSADLVDSVVNHNLGQLTLELTERCNLNCEYCIYGNQNNTFREFGQGDMSFDTAKKAIDYAAAHSGERLAITFYGGEPLLKFDLLRNCVEYAQSTIKNKELSYSITTNLVLMTPEIATYLASIDRFMVVCSMDGPEEIHDEYRRFPSGIGSHKYVIRGLKNLVDAIGDNTVGRMSFSMVMANVSDKDYFDKIQRFFDSLDWLPSQISKNVTYAQWGKKPEEYQNLESEYELEYMDRPVSEMDPAREWTEHMIKDINNIELEINPLYTAKRLDDGLLSIHNRGIYNIPIQGYHFNGCCIPGARRLYTTVDGYYKVCERVGISPYIGHVDTGYDLNVVMRYYINDFMTGAVKYCNKCWAVQLCSLCYLECFNESGLDISGRHALCRSHRYTCVANLKKYHEILESSPESLDYLNQYRLY